MGGREDGGAVVLPICKMLWKSRNALHSCEANHNSRTTSLISFSGLPIYSCDEEDILSFFIQIDDNLELEFVLKRISCSHVK